MKQKEVWVALAIPVNNKKFLMRTLFILIIFISAIVSCKPTKKIQTAIIKKDSTAIVIVDHAKEDSIRVINDTYHSILANHIDYITFLAKIDVDYIDVDDKKYNVIVFF